MPREYYQLASLNDLAELNRILDSISRRLNNISADGENTTLGGKKITNLAAALSSSDAVRKDQIAVKAATFVANQLIKANSNLELETVVDLTAFILATADEITITSGSGTITISLPDAIKLDGATASRLLATDANKKTASANLISWIATAAAARLTVSDDGDGSVTLDHLGLLSDGTAGRVLRMGRLTIADGTNPNTIKCTFTNEHNATAIAVTDNIAKGATTGSFTLDAGGTVLTFFDNVLGCHGFVVSGIANNIYTAGVNKSGTAISARLRSATTNQDLTVLADSDTYTISIIYTTSS